MRYTKLLLLLLSLLVLPVGFSLAKADESWMPDHYQTLKPVFEHAADFEASQSSFILGLPEGMKAECTMNELGVIEYMIDTAGTDWARVMVSSYENSSRQVFIRPGVKKPEQAVSRRAVRFFVDPFSPERTIIENVEKATLHVGADATSSYWIGRYDEATNTYLPEVRTKSPVGLAVFWYDAKGECISKEFILYTINYTNADPFTVSIPKVPAEDITPNVSVSAGGHGTSITAGKANGLVRYEVAQPEQLKNMTVTTAIAAPQLGEKNTANWTCYMRISGDSSASACQMASAGEYGLTRRSALLVSQLDKKAFTEQTSLSLEWRDENGVVQHISHLSSVVICGEPQPWPMYAGWNPVPENRLKLTYVNPIKSGTSLTYDEATGIAHFHINPSELPESAAYGDANFVMEFTPPEDATAYAFFNGNSENAFGSKDYVTQNIQSWIEQNGRHASSSGFQLTQRLFKPYRQESRDLTIFASDMILGEWASEYLVINWYRHIDDPAPMTTEYVFRRMDNCIRTEVSRPLSGDDQIAGRITSTAIVIPNNNAAAQMQFVAEMYPLEAETSRFYELRLLDEQGARANLPAKSKIILPYPEGTSFEDVTISFSLRHLNAKYQTIEVFSEADGTLHREKDHLWFVPSSLSPFVLEWMHESAVQLPSTGDGSHPFAALAALTLASAALYMQMKRRKN